MGDRRAYVFSLDAFVAFSLILLSIQSLLIMSSQPASYSRQLLQAKFLAQDTLDVMKIALPPCPSGVACINQTYIDLIRPFITSPNTCFGSSTCQNWLKNISESAIPPQYSYAFFYDNLQAGQGSNWTLYNASADPSSPRYGIPYRRVQASGQIPIAGYSLALQRGSSPYCNVVCQGYHIDNNTGQGVNQSSGDACTTLPCGDDVPADNYISGEYSVGMLRMVVWG